MRIEFDTGVPVFLTWTGKAFRINDRFAIGFKRGKLGKTTPFIRNKPEYKKFIEDMAMVFRSQPGGLCQIDGTVYVGISIFTKKRSSSPDIDAYNKQILDALQLSGVLKNDSQVAFLTTHHAKKDMDDDTIIVTVARIPDPSKISIQSYAWINEACAISNLE